MDARHTHATTIHIPSSSPDPDLTPFETCTPSLLLSHSFQSLEKGKFLGRFGRIRKGVGQTIKYTGQFVSVKAFVIVNSIIYVDFRFPFHYP